MKKTPLSWATKTSHSTPDTRQLPQPGSRKINIVSWINPLNERYQRFSMTSGHYCNHFPSTKHFICYNLQPVNLVLHLLMQPVCLLLRGHLRPPLPTCSGFETKTSQAPCWLANCQRAMGRHRFYTQATKNSRPHSNNEGSSRCCPIQENNFLLLNFTLLLSSPLQGYCFDSFKKKTDGS